MEKLKMYRELALMMDLVIAVIDLHIKILIGVPHRDQLDLITILSQ